MFVKKKKKYEFNVEHQFEQTTFSDNPQSE